MKLTRRHFQTDGGLLAPNVSFPEQSCSCRACRGRGLLGWLVRRRS